MGDMISWRRYRPASRASAAQHAMCRRLAVEPSPPGQRTMVGFALSRPRELEPLNALRHPVAGSSNGWFVWRGPAIPHEDDTFFAPLHVEHLDEYAPQLEPYLALPPGWGVVLAPGYEDVWYDETLLGV
ncbi:immunity protein Imm33 domain-containing protein [Micromonospora echinaurantiaca]|uniref:immunity protein Imm33 domain-containing protein n=1 Tax=Micromonospora echinaurantiaca TaxID=47857 RepID=UPI003438C5AB